jgi:hypothetical protein
MFRSLLVTSSFAFILASGCVLGGCSADGGGPQSTEHSGSLELPLLSSSGGHSYRLTGYLYTYGPSYVWSDLGVDEPAISLALQTGHYTAYLYSAGLARDDGKGSFVPVQATLVSNGVPFDIYDGAASSISFAFQTDGALVRVGAGTLEVRADVSEGAAVCTPFANDCGDGSWCPPTELTGAPRACVAAGSVAVGDSCSSPLDCVADASCFDFGAGPVCGALCPSALFDQACSDTTTCIAAGSDYGVCRPNPSP